MIAPKVSKSQADDWITPAQIKQLEQMGFTIGQHGVVYEKAMTKQKWGCIWAPDYFSEERLAENGYRRGFIADTGESATDIRHGTMPVFDDVIAAATYLVVHHAGL
jgi:hypothetical protein